MVARSTTLSTDEREFLQRRVGGFGLFVAASFLFFLVYRTGVALALGLLREFESPSFWYHLASALCFLATWGVCRARTLSRRALRRVETAGLLSGVTFATLMGLHIPVVARPDFILLLALTYTVVGRAIFVPSSARRTFVLTALIGIPLAITMYLVFLDEEFLRAWQSISGQAPDATPSGFAMFSAIHVSVWWSLTVFAATSASKVIYGLRREVRDAKRLGQYQLESKLGEGAMGVVYRARHALLQRPTAIKLLLPERAGEANVKRFEAEVRQTARLRHRNTVTIFDYGHTADGTFYYAMEYLDGLTLEEVVRRGGPQRPGRVVRILEQMAAALVEAHGTNLVHRDIKPANAILFLPHRYGGVADEVKLLDFGLVKELAGEGSIVLTHADSISGTPQYMAPEAITDPKHVDGRADLYAVGAVGYYLLTGESVFSGATTVEVCSHHLHTRPEPPSKRLGGPVPQALEDLILACLAKDRSDRPQSAGDLGQRLGRCRASVEPWTAEDATAWWSRYRDSTSQRDTGLEPSETLLAVDRRRGQSDREKSRLRK